MIRHRDVETGADEKNERKAESRQVGRHCSRPRDPAARPPGRREHDHADESDSDVGRFRKSAVCRAEPRQRERSSTFPPRPRVARREDGSCAQQQSDRAHETARLFQRGYEEPSKCRRRRSDHDNRNKDDSHPAASTQQQSTQAGDTGQRQDLYNGQPAQIEGSRSDGSGDLQRNEARRRKPRGTHRGDSSVLRLQYRSLERQLSGTADRDQISGAHQSRTVTLIGSAVDISEYTHDGTHEKNRSQCEYDSGDDARPQPPPRLSRRAGSTPGGRHLRLSIHVA